MRPPICIFCSKDFRGSISEGGLVSFKLSIDEIESNLQQVQSNIVAHPKGQEWFCGEHIEVAKKLAHLNLSSALLKMSPTPLLKEEIESTSVMNIFNVINKNWLSILKLLVVDEEIIKAIPTSRKDKSWSPMDGFFPPNCPYSVSEKKTIVHGETSISNSYTVAYWNDDEKSSSHYSFYYIRKKQTLFAMSAYASANNPINYLDFEVNRTLTDEFKQAIAQIVVLFTCKRGTQLSKAIDCKR